MKKKVIVGMSGGVDSSVAAYLLKQDGYDVIGITMLTWQEGDTGQQKMKSGQLEKQSGQQEMESGQPEKHTEQQEGESACGGMAAVEDARKVAQCLDIPYYILDFRKEFKCNVMDYFVEEYLHGRTPNPCVVCNRHVKWDALLKRGMELGADYIATGHYARIDKLPNSRYAVRNSITAAKDQTYALYNLTQEQLSRTLMPIGEYTKDEIRKIALDAGLPVAHKADSQDVCFIPDNDYAAFIESAAGEKVPGPGNFVNAEGKILGIHKGITHYTIGQRRGLELPMGERVFVTEIRPETNEVVVGKNEDIFTTTVLCNRVNYMAMADLKRPRRALAKIRYNHKGEYCMLEELSDGKVLCTFEQPVRAATPGQAVVFYEGEYVLGGGTILHG